MCTRQPRCWPEWAIAAGGRGVEKVRETGRTFRDEGTGASHKPELTRPELHGAHCGYHTMARSACELIQAAA